MNEAQRDELIRKVRDLLGEHCVSFAVIMEVELTPEEESDDQGTLLMHTWTGTFTNAIGLVERFRNRLRKSDEQTMGSDEDEDDGDEWKAAK